MRMQQRHLQLMHQRIHYMYRAENSAVTLFRFDRYMLHLMQKKKEKKLIAINLQKQNIHSINITQNHWQKFIKSDVL